MPDQILQEIKDRLNIADVISGYIPIKKAGVNFKAVCPFHNEKTPSLVISPQKQIWHCFGCGEGGDIFGFVTRYENLEFKEALKILAEKAGVKLPSYSKVDSRANEDEKELLLRINNFAARYYHEILLKDKRGSSALEYLKKRGLTEGTLKQWQIGYAPDDFHALERALTAKNVSLQQAIKAGVLSKNERGQMYDRFRGRITFPIYNYFGEIVGFSARILHDDGRSAKYVNSPETVIYNKSKILFGLNFAKEAIRKKEEMIIVEGQMDCITLHQAGFNNVIAASGTAYNEQAIDFTSARRLTTNVKLCFDSDSAGQMALRKTGEALLKQDFKVKVIVLKLAKDPDELVRKSQGLWDKAVFEAERFLDFYINLAKQKYPTDKVDQLNYLSDQILPLFAFIQDPLEQGHYIQKIVKDYSVSERDLRDKLQKIKQPQKKAALIDSNHVLGAELIQKEVLGGLLTVPEFLQEVRSQIEPEDFEDPGVRRLAEARLSPDFKELNVNGEPLANEAIFMVESQLDDLAGDAQKLFKSLKKSYTLLKLKALTRKQQHLQGEIKLAESQGNKDKVEELKKNFASLLVLRAELGK